MALRRFCTECNKINSLHISNKRLFASKGVSKEIAQHIEQLKSIASESNKEHILPEHNNLNKPKHKSKSKYIDKYQFSYYQSKREQKQIQKKQRLSKTLNDMHSHLLPIAQGRIIDAPLSKPLKTESNTHSFPSSEIQSVLSKFTEISSHKPSIPIPKIELDEVFEKSKYVNSDGINNERVSMNEKLINIDENDNNDLFDDERMEKEAMELSLAQHNKDVSALKEGLFKNELKTQNLREYIDTKRRELLNAEREHFYIKNGKSTFSDIGVSDLLSEKLRLLGYKCPSVIQSLFIKQFHALERKNTSLIMGAETGSGKTLAFAIPIIDELIEEYLTMDIIGFNSDNIALETMVTNKEKLPFLKYPKCVIIEPTSELCNQVRGVIQSITRPFGFRVESWTENNIPSPMHCLYDYLYSHYGSETQIESSPEILIVTPNVFKHVFDTRFALRLNYLIFDEADIMLTHKSGMGHWRHTEQILKQLQTYQKDKLLSGYNSNLHRFKPCLYIFSGATLANKRVMVFLGKHGARSKKQKKTALPENLMKLFKKSIWIVSPLQHRYSPNLTQKWLFCRDNHEKQELLLRSLHRHPAQKTRYKREMQSFPSLQQTIIFCNNKTSANDCKKFLKFNHILCCEVIHEDIEYQKREQILHEFINNKKVSILICTDMMSRGYDFGSNIECVIQCDFARTPDIHYNRTGRTARAGRKGLVINLYMSNNSDIVKELVNISNQNLRIDRLFKTKTLFKNKKMTKRTRKKLKKLGITPPPTVKEQIEKFGIKPRKKHRDFRFTDPVQLSSDGNKDKNDGKVSQKKVKQRNKKVDGSLLQSVHWKGDHNSTDHNPFDFDQFVLDTDKIISKQE